MSLIEIGEIQKTKYQLLEIENFYSCIGSKTNVKRYSFYGLNIERIKFNIL